MQDSSTAVPADEADDTAFSDDKSSSVLWLPPLTMWIWLAVCVVPAMGLMYYFAPEGWNLFQIGFAGLMAGLWCFFCIFINRILVTI